MTVEGGGHGVPFLGVCVKPERRDAMTAEQKLIKPRMNLLELAAYLNYFSDACRVMGYSRDTFYRIKKAHDQGGIEALKKKIRRQNGGVLLCLW